MDGYQGLATGIVLQAALDLQKIYKATMDAHKRERNGTLSPYIEKVSLKSRRKGIPASDYLFPVERLTAILFFKDDNDMKDIAYGLQGREGNTKTINAMRDYCLENTMRIRRKIDRIERDIRDNVIAQ